MTTAFRNNKKGLSEVVTTVVLILIVVAAIVLIWAFVSPVITGTGKQVTADCVTTQLEVTKCDLTTNTVTVRRLAGKGDLKEIRLIHDGVGPIISLSNSAIEELETATTTNFAEVATEVQPVAIVGDDLRICAPTSAPFPCS